MTSNFKLVVNFEDARLDRTGGTSCTIQKQLNQLEISSGSRSHKVLIPCKVIVGSSKWFSICMKWLNEINNMLLGYFLGRPQVC